MHLWACRYGYIYGCMQLTMVKGVWLAELDEEGWEEEEGENHCEMMAVLYFFLGILIWEFLGVCIFFWISIIFFLFYFWLLPSTKQKADSCVAGPSDLKKRERREGVVKALRRFPTEKIIGICKCKSNFTHTHPK